MQIYQIFKTWIIWVTFRVAVVVEQMMLRFLQVRKRSASRHELPGLVRFFCWVMMMVFKGNWNFCILGAEKIRKINNSSQTFDWCLFCAGDVWCFGGEIDVVEINGLMVKVWGFSWFYRRSRSCSFTQGRSVPVVFSNGYTQLKTTGHWKLVVGDWLVGDWKKCSCLLDFVWSHVFRGKVGNDSLVLVSFFQGASRFHRAVLMLLSTSMTLM